MRTIRLATVLAAGLAAALLCAVPAAEAPAGVPYTDPAVRGYLGFCNASGKQVTQGSVNDTPFVKNAVSSSPAVAPYNKPGRSASLYGFQPRQGIPAQEWSGEGMTAAARYSNPNSPMTAATGRDDSLADLIADYPAVWDGYLEIRLYLGAPDEPIDSVTYAATSVQVTGTTWKVVGAAGKVNCHAGTAESVEAVLLPASELAAPSTPSSAAHPVTTASANRGAAVGTRRSAVPGAVANAASVTTPGHHSQDGSWLVVIVLGGLAGVTVIAAKVRRRSLPMTAYADAAGRVDGAGSAPPATPPATQDRQ